MMNTAEVQLAIYFEVILRHRGYPDAADRIAEIVGVEVDRRARSMSPSDAGLRPTG